MVGLNRVQLIGRLGRDPELKNIPNGKKSMCLQRGHESPLERQRGRTPGCHRLV